MIFVLAWRNSNVFASIYACKTLITTDHPRASITWEMHKKKVKECERDQLVCEWKETKCLHGINSLASGSVMWAKQLLLWANESLPKSTCKYLTTRICQAFDDNYHWQVQGPNISKRLLMMRFMVIISLWIDSQVSFPNNDGLNLMVNRLSK